jgi:hypothetical protein
VDDDCRQAAAIAVDSDIQLRHAGSDYIESRDGNQKWVSVVEVIFHIPTSSKSLVKNDKSISDVFEYAASEVLQERMLELEVQNDNYTEWLPVKAEMLRYLYTTKLLEVEPNWQSTVRRLVTGRGIANQGNITEKVFARENKEVIPYNEMKFGSRTEIRIAQELEKRRVLFFPLPLAVRADTGKAYQDHKEVDFLVCSNGAWGILEVSHHDSARYEMDKEKDAWFKKSGILCIEHYTAKRCYDSPDVVVEEFLSILAQHRK